MLKRDQGSLDVLIALIPLLSLFALASRRDGDAPALCLGVHAGVHARKARAKGSKYMSMSKIHS